MKNNEHFADLFNAALFNGSQVIKPEDLSEADTDVSSLLKFNNHTETIQRIWDVVKKKTAYGVDFVILGLENQCKIHYAMPLRTILGDALSYLKEYNEIARQKQTRKKKFSSSDEFLSGLKKDRPFAPLSSVSVFTMAKTNGISAFPDRHAMHSRTSHASGIRL